MKKEKENLILRIIKFLGRLIHAIFLFLLSIIGFFLYPSKDKKNQLKNQENLVKASKNIKIKDKWEEIVVPNTLTSKPLKEITKEELKSITEEIISKIIEMPEEEKKEEIKKIIELKEEVLPILDQAIVENKIKKPKEVVGKIYETVEKHLRKEETILKNEKTLEKQSKETLDLKKKIKKIYLKELKQEEMYLIPKEEKLLQEIEKQVLEAFEAKNSELEEIKDLEEEIKQEIKKYCIKLLKEGKTKEYEISDKINKYLEKIIEENKRITLIPEKREEDRIEEAIVQEKRGPLEQQNPITFSEEPKFVLKTENLKEETKEKLEEEKKEPIEEQRLTSVNFSFVNKESKELEVETKKELLKTELEEKEYEKIEQRIENLLIFLETEKNKKIPESTKLKLELEEQKLMNLKKSLKQDQAKTIENERLALNEKISLKELNGLQLEINKLYLEDHVQQANHLEHYSYEKQEEIKKMLITSNLKKACKWSRFPLLFSLPFVRNKFFYFFTGSVLFSHHLNVYNRLLNNQKIEALEENLSEIEVGAQALDGAIEKTIQNKALLEELVTMSLIKYPELKSNREFRRYEKRIKENLIHTSQKLERKKAIIEKYHLKSENLMRKLKKNLPIP